MTPGLKVMRRTTSAAPGPMPAPSTATASGVVRARATASGSGASRMWKRRSISAISEAATLFGLRDRCG